MKKRSHHYSDSMRTEDKAGSLKLGKRHPSLPRNLNCMRRGRPFAFNGAAVLTHISLHLPLA